MTNRQDIPDIIIGRLPVYLRALQHMAGQGRQTISSRELGEVLSMSPAQIRKDLSQFGGFGKQGTGYSIPFLIDKLREILRVQEVRDVVVVGMGDMGHALARYDGFRDRGFRVAMVFDKDTGKTGQKAGDFNIRDTRDLVRDVRASGIELAMLCVPASEAQAVADQLVKAGVKAILNYAPISITVPEGVRIQYLDPSIGLQRMAYYL
jgi:redox-sensing transcriptional repressor